MGVFVHISDFHRTSEGVGKEGAAKQRLSLRTNQNESSSQVFNSLNRVGGGIGKTPDVSGVSLSRDRGSHEPKTSCWVTETALFGRGFRGTCWGRRSGIFSPKALQRPVTQRRCLGKPALMARSLARGVACGWRGEASSTEPCEVTTRA